MKEGGGGVKKDGPSQGKIYLGVCVHGVSLHVRFMQLSFMCVVHISHANSQPTCHIDSWPCLPVPKQAGG